MPRVKLFDKKEVLLKAMELFWEQGYASTSLSDLTKHLKISKSSFYDTFGSKREIFEDAFAIYRDTNVNTMLSVLDSEDDPRVGIRKLFEFNLGITRNSGVKLKVKNIIQRSVNSAHSFASRIINDWNALYRRKL